MTRDRIIAILRSNAADIRAASVVALYLYGSAVDDRARDDSDFDLFADVDYGRFGFVPYMHLRDCSRGCSADRLIHDSSGAASRHQVGHRIDGREGFR